VNFRVSAGEVVALVGDNGAGKSTLVKAIAGIHEIDDGEIRFAGQPVKINTPVDAHEAWNRDGLPGPRAVRQPRRGGEPVPGARGDRGRPGEDRPARSTRPTWKQRSHELLQNLAVTITSVRAEVGTMSGGQRQQVAIARSLLGEPKVVLLDEPTAALGVRQTAQVLALIKRLRERGLGVVVISHNLVDVFEVADRIYVLRLGQEAGDYKASETSSEEIISAITGLKGGSPLSPEETGESTGGQS